VTQHPHLAGPHPAEHELADLLDGLLRGSDRDGVEQHVAACPVCSQVVGGAADDAPEIAPPDTAGTGLPTLPDPVWRRLAMGVVTAPAPGQVWRLRGGTPAGEVAQLVAVIRADEELLVAPVTADEQAATDLWTLQLDLDSADTALAVWVSLSAVVGAEVLDVHLGSVDAGPLLEAHVALRRGEQPPRGQRTGRQPDAELHAYRAQLAAHMSALSEARLLPEVAFLDDEPVGAAGDLVDALREAGWDLLRLKALLGVTASHARRVLQREQGLTEAQAEQVRAALGVAVAAPAVTAPAGWVREVAAPARRRRFERVAGARGADSWQFRAEQALAYAQQAARGHHGDDPDWAALVDQHLARLEDDAGLRPGR
jgi:hypothetical protein